MMQLNSVVLFVSNIDVSKKFYQQILGFNIVHDFGANIVFAESVALWQINENHKIAKNLSTKGNSNRMELYFETEDIDAVYEKLKSANINFFHPVDEEPWGQRTVRFFDPDYHLIEIGETLGRMVKNMFEKNMDMAQIQHKTGLTKDAIQTLLHS